jgi:hypothetical protein
MDQHYVGPVSRALVRHGIDVLTAQDAGRCGLPDAFTADEMRNHVEYL